MSNSDSNWEEKTSFSSYIVKIVKHMIIFFIFVYIILTFYHNKNFQFENLSESEIQMYSFYQIFPKISLDKNAKIPTLRELFFERNLYINDSILTNEYIRFIRPNVEYEDQLYNENKFINYEFEENFKVNNREGQMNMNDFYNLNKEEKMADIKRYNIWELPFVSVIIPFYNQEADILRTVRSVQNQSLKNIEIIIVDDSSLDNCNPIFVMLLKTDPRIRIFHHLNHMGQWRSRIDGFLYSKGRYILQYDVRDLFIDNFALEDIYITASKYKIDSVRFSYQKARGEIIDNFNFRKVYTNTFRKIQYGKCDYRSEFVDYGLLRNRLTRASIYNRAFNLIHPIILNLHKDLWDDVWWNELGNLVNSSYVSINRDGYLIIDSHYDELIFKRHTPENEERLIKEFINFWLFNYYILPEENNKTTIIQDLYNFALLENNVNGRTITLDYLKHKCFEYEHLLKKLIKDKYVSDNDKEFVKNLLYNYAKIAKKAK